MKKTTGKKLTLDTAVVRQLHDQLTPEQLQNVAGGSRTVVGGTGGGGGCTASSTSTKPVC
jgi:hypothetical protein